MKYSSSKQSAQQGFTIIELLLALAVFSFVLVFITTAFLQIFRTYNRGIARKEVNQSARLLLEDITSKMRTVVSPVQIDTSQLNRGRLCVGSYSYVWNPVNKASIGGWTNNQVDGAVVNLVRVDGDNGHQACNPSVANITDGTPTSMFSERVGVLMPNSSTPAINVALASAQIPDIYSVGLTVSTTRLDLLDVLNKCVTQNTSSPYCAQITLRSTIGLRNR